MRKITFILFYLFALCFQSKSQNNLIIRVKDAETHEPLALGVVSLSDTLSGLTDTMGLIVFPDMKNGNYEIRISSIGYFKKKIEASLPGKANDTIEVKLEAQEEEMGEIVVVSTRTKQNVDALPTRVEVVPQDELEERSTDKPSDISHAVKEQQGIQIQNTSATSGSFNIRMEGLRGKYVEILKDGFPLFGGLSQDLSISQISPLDLQQIELIKGPASTLYGADAISGVINLISKTPQETPEYDVLLNVEDTKSTDVGIYASQKVKWFAYSLTGQFRDQKAYDWDDDNFADVPKLDRWSVTPQLFFDLNSKAKLNMGFNYSDEHRLGGAMAAIYHQNDTAFQYLEDNTTYRYGSNLKFDYDLGAKGNISFRNSINLFSRELSISDYRFGGKQYSSTSELHYHRHIKKHDIVVGADFKTDKFAEDDSIAIKRNYNFLTGGVFAQEIYTPVSNTALEGGLRFDYNQQYHFFALPHVAWMQRWNEVFRTKLNFGMGYKLPTVFQDESEEANYRNVLPIGDSVKPELSFGGTFDLAVRPLVKNGWHVEINEMIFYTHILHPLLADTANNQISFYNGNGYIQAVGLETNFKIGYRGVDLSVAYTLQDQTLSINGVNSIAPLTSKHIVSLFGGYSWRNRFVIGIDCYYWSAEQLSDGTTAHPIWEVGVNAQVKFKWFDLFANLENILNITQGRYGSIVFPNPTYNQPRFAEIYGPLEGRLFNAGVKFKLAAFIKKGKTKKDDD